jgi:hypothetical protein
MSESTKEAAARIREQLKAEKGWNARDVSIKVEYYSGGSSIHATVRNARVRAHELKEILESGERIHRDEYSGEILSGSNRYVHMHYTDDVKRELADPFVAPIERALEQLKHTSDNGLVTVEGLDVRLARHEVLLGWDGGRQGALVRTWAGGRAAFLNGMPQGQYRTQCVEGMAFQLAQLLQVLDAEMKAEAAVQP